MFLPVDAGIGYQAIDALALSSLGLYDAAKPARGWSSIIGVVTAIIGNILISFALNTQRYAHIKIAREAEDQQEEPKSDETRGRQSGGYGTQQHGVAEEGAKQGGSAHDDQAADENEPLLRSPDSSRSSETSPKHSSPTTSYLKSPWWWLGISLMTVGECGNFLAYGFAPASIVSPLGVVALVSNCMIAPWMLHERFRKRDALGVVIAVAGCVTVVLSASGSDPKLDANEIWHLITRWEFETYLGTTLVLIIGLMAASGRYGQNSIFIDLGLVGLFGGYTALSTKGVASLLSNKIWRVVTFPITYLLVAVLVVTAVMQIKYVNRALQRFDSTQVIPTQFVLFTLSVIIGSAVLYRDFESMTGEDAAKFFGGCTLTFGGVWFITSGRSRNQDENDSQQALDEEEDAIDLLDETGQQPEIREREDSDARRQSSLQPPSPKRLQLTRSMTPAFTFTSHDETAGFNFGEPSPFNTNDAWNAPPAVTSAIHPPKSTVLAASNSTQPRKPAFHATTSAPILPTSIRGGRPMTPTRNTGPVSPELLRSRSGVRTPRNQRSLEPLSSPPTASTLRSPFGSMKRQSIIGMMPGPLTAPLSSSLSAVVADSLRRGVDVSHHSSAKGFRRRPLRATKSQRLDLPRASIVEDEQSAGQRSMSMNMGSVEEAEGEDASPQKSPRGRERSFSATWGDMFRTKRLRRATLDGQEAQRHDH